MSTIPAAYDNTPLTTVENTAFPTSEPRGDSPWSPVRRPSAHGPVEGPPLLDLEPGRNATTGAQLRGRDDAGVDDRYDELGATGAAQPRSRAYREASADSDESAHPWSDARARQRRRTSGYGSVSINGDDRCVTVRRRRDGRRVCDERYEEDDSDDGDNRTAPSRLTTRVPRRSTGLRCSRDDMDDGDVRVDNRVRSRVVVPNHTGLLDDDGDNSDDQGERRRSSKRSQNGGFRRRRSSSRRNRRRRRSSRSREHDSSTADDSAGAVVQNVGLRRHRIKPRTFDGSGSFETFWAHFDNCATYNRWNEDDKLAHLKAALVGDAGQTLWDSDASAVNTLEKLTALLCSRYSGSRLADKHRMELRLRRRRAGESLSALHQDIRRLMALAHPKLQQEAREAIACDYFIDAMDDAEFALKIRKRAPSTLDEALRVALQLEAWTKDARQRGSEAYRKPKVRGAVDDDDVANFSKRMDRLEADFNRRLDDLMKLQKAEIRKPDMSAVRVPSVSFAESNDAARSSNDVKLQPNSSQHVASFNESKAAWPRKQQGFRRSPAVCWRCGQPGHMQRNCKLPASQPDKKLTGAVNRGSRGLDRANVYVRMQLGDKLLPCLLDSGCEITLMPKSVVEAARNVEVLPCSQRLWAANGTEIEITGEATVPLLLDGRCISTRALVSPDVEEVMLGSDWLQAHDCLWDFGHGRLFIDGRAAVTLSRKHRLSCRRIFAQEDLVLPPRQQVDVPARSTLLSPRKIGADWIVDSHQVRPGLYVGRTLLPAAHHDIKVRMVNTTAKPQTIPSGTCLGNLQPVDVLDEPASAQAPASADETPATDVMSALLEKLPDDMTSEQRQQVQELLCRYDDVFSHGTFDMGRTSLVEHTIDTGSQRPIRQGLRRHPTAYLEIIDKQVDELIQNDFVEPAASAWASNVVLVRKKDGSHRLCVDYRAVNAATYKDTYPLPHIDTCLGSMDGAVWFTTLDLRSGYHAIPIKESDRDKTAFITRRGCFRYKVLPFGLTISVFQRLMDLVLCGLTYVTCLVYLDDIIIYSRDFDSHVQRLQEVFERLRGANLKLHVKKCCMFQRKVAFLGHVLSEAGIAMQEDKVAAIRDWPTPRNLSQLRSFLGLCSYYRRFIPGFADVAAPLHALQRKQVQFTWTSEQEDAFNRLKERLTSAPVLGMPTDEGTFYLDCDASDVGLGAVISQRQGNSEVVIAYASRALSRPERNYDVTRRELLAIVYGLKAYKQYLLGRHFVIRTDHAALQWLRKTPEPMAQLARWLVFIEQFDFDVLHRPGARHGNADGLSRKPVAADDDSFLVRQSSGDATAADADVSTDVLESSAGEPPSLPDELLADLQLLDPEIGPVARLRQQQEEKPSIEELLPESEATKMLHSQWELLELIDGVLYRRWCGKEGKPEVLQLLVPATLRQDYMSRAHSGMCGGHLGLRRTLDQVQRRAFWFGWRRDVRRFCKQCPNCNGYFRGQLPRSGPLQPMLTGAPLERLHLDLTGPHPRSRRGSVFIVTCVDPFTKWAEAFPAPNKEAATVAKIIVEQVICRFGTPLSIVTDRAKELDGELMREICRLLDVDKLRTTAYKASTNAAAERFHRTLNSMIGKMIDENQRDWDSLLPYVMAAYRSSRHEATQFTPNYLMLGREVRAPVDVVYGSPEAEQPNSYDDYADELHQRLLHAYSFVREHLQEAARRSKRYYDLRVREQRYNVGDWVYYYNPRKYVGRQDKWNRKFTGPFLVVGIPGPVNVKLQRSRRAKPFYAHVDKVKPYLADNLPTPWISEPADETKEPATEAVNNENGEPARLETEADAIAGVPSVHEYRSPRPQRHAGRPRRYLD